MELVYRPGQAADLPAVVDLLARCRAIAMPYLPVLHTRDEDLGFFARYLENAALTLALAPQGLVGFMATTPGWIEQLYLDPDWRGRGVGETFLGRAKATQPRLQLWCFADNHAAQRFYLRHGFVEERRTAGDNEEQLPDILYGWTRPDWLRDRP